MNLSEKVILNKRVRYAVPFIILFTVFVITRFILLQNVILLEDHDSVSYLLTIEVFLTYSLKGIYNLDPDTSLFYPFLGAIFSLPGWSVEMGARLATLFSQCVLFIAILGIGLKMGNRSDVLVGLTLFTLNPAFIKYGVSVLTEPTYVAVVYFGMFVFWRQLSSPTKVKAFIVGGIFGLAFLTRLEGLIFIVVVPLFYFIFYLLKKPKYITGKDLIVWIVIFLLGFSLFAVPKVYRVSDQMNTFAIDGRQAWTLLLHSQEGKTGTELIYGLDFSDEKVNIRYVKENLEEFLHLDTGTSNNYVKQYAQTIMVNYFDLERNRLNSFFGSIILIFFAFGLFSLYRKHYHFELTLILLFLVVTLIPPMLHNVVIRHILIIGPIVLLIAGFGILFVSRSLLEHKKNKNHYFNYILPIVFLIAACTPLSHQLKNVYNPPEINHEYSLIQLQKPLEIVKHIAKNELEGKPTIAARKVYLGYYAQANRETIPYAEYDALVKYFTLNNVDFLYLNHYLVRHYPFIDEFQSGDVSNDFELLYQGNDLWSGEKIELYRFRSNEHDTRMIQE